MTEKDHVDIVEVRKLKPAEIELARKLQRLVVIIHDALKTKLNKIEEVKKFATDLKPFQNDFKFLDQAIINELEKSITSHDKMIAAKDLTKKHMPTLKNSSAELSKSFLASDWATAKIHAEKIKQIFDDVDHHVNAPEHISRILKNRFTAEPMIFLTTGLLEYLGDTEYNKIREIDLSKTLYTAVDFPIAKMKSEFHYLLYFMLHLQETPEPVSLKYYSDFRTHLRVKHANDGALEDLLKITDRYLHANDKALIPKIVALIKKIPSLDRINQKNKAKIKLVYRGIGVSDEDRMTEQKIIEHDKKLQYVATSDSRHAAKNFALQKGHLEGEDSRRSDVGYIITYQVTPAAILFDTKLIDTAFNESEILIDATKATVKEIEEI